MRICLNIIIKTTFIGLFVCPIILFAQSGNFVIKGKMGDFNAPAKIFLSYRSADGINVKDSCALENGNFEIKGHVDRPANMVFLRLQRFKGDRDNGIRDWWLEPGTMLIYGTDSLATAKVTGSKLTADWRKLNAALALFSPMTNTLYKSKNLISKNEFAKQEKEINEGKIAVVRDFIISNPNSLVSLFVLWVTYGPMKYNNKRGIEEVEPMFNGFSAEVRNSKMGKDYRALLESWKTVGIGQLAPDFTLYDQERKPVKLSDFKGKYVLVDFWASWCGPCRAENPNLLAQYQLFKDKKFEILGVSIDVDKDRDKWLKAIKDDHLTWMQVVGQIPDNEARLKFHVQSIPDNFLISPDGHILAKGLRGEELNKKLIEVLVEKK